MQSTKIFEILLTTRKNVYTKSVFGHKFNQKMKAVVEQQILLRRNYFENRFVQSWSW